MIYAVISIFILCHHLSNGRIAGMTRRERCKRAWAAWGIGLATATLSEVTTRILVKIFLSQPIALSLEEIISAPATPPLILGATVAAAIGFYVQHRMGKWFIPPPTPAGPHHSTSEPGRRRRFPSDS